MRECCEYHLMLNENQFDVLLEFTQIIIEYDQMQFDVTLSITMKLIGQNRSIEIDFHFSDG